MRLWCRYAKTATSILDIGAHTGVYALAAASLRKDIPIHAFEPNPFTAARLRVNKHLNGLDHIVEHPIALANESGLGPLSWPVREKGWLSSGAGLGAPRAGRETTVVQVKQLDELAIVPGNHALMKIDAEGSEYNVFAGMPQFLKSRPAIILESFFQEACDIISRMVHDYAFYLVDEAGHLVERDKLYAANHKTEHLNQLLWPKERGTP